MVGALGIYDSKGASASPPTALTGMLRGSAKTAECGHLLHERLAVSTRQGDPHGSAVARLRETKSLFRLCLTRDLRELKSSNNPCSKRFLYRFLIGFPCFVLPTPTCLSSESSKLASRASRVKRNRMSEGATVQDRALLLDSVYFGLRGSQKC